KAGDGNMTLAGFGSNSFTGTTTVVDGTLVLRKNGLAFNGNLTVGDAFGAFRSAVVQVALSNQFPAVSNVAINSDGVLGFGGGVAQTVASLDMTGGVADS